jgi:hypothetical protein
MPALVAGIHVLASAIKDVDGRGIGERKRRRPSDGYARRRRWLGLNGPCFLHIASQLMYLGNAPVTLRMQKALIGSGEFRCRSIRT